MTSDISISKVISTFIQETRRKIKVRLQGKVNVQSAHQALPYGMDSNPIPEMKAIYARTELNGRPVIIGYINKNVLADNGEMRLFSTNGSGTLQTYIWLTNDGIIELGGDDKHLARFEELKTGFDQLKTDFNAHVHAGNGVPPTTPTTASIDDAKINEIKTL